MFLKRVSLICEGALTDVMKSCSPRSQVNNSSWLTFLFLLLLPALWLSLPYPTFLCHRSTHSTGVSLLVQGHIPGLPPSVRAGLNTSPTLKNSSSSPPPPSHLTHSPASCAETGTVTCASSFHFRTHTHTPTVNKFTLEISHFRWKQKVYLLSGDWACA